jgi:glycosyltransferase involved in cell wall biosynthesis
VFLSVTKLGPDRGNETMIEAFEAVRKQVPKAHLCIVYQPTLYHRMPVRYAHMPWVTDPVATRARLEQLIEQRGLKDSVSLVEMKSPVKHEPYYAASDVMVAPFEGELFSSVNLIEGMVFGQPLIVSDIGEPADIVDRWGAGVKVPQKNPAELAKAMVEFARNDALRQSLSQKARTAAKEFGVDAVADRLTRLYTRIGNADQMHSERVGATG